MRKANERRLVVILFVLVMITYSMAQLQSRKLDALYLGLKAVSAKFSSPLTFLPTEHESSDN